MKTTINCLNHEVTVFGLNARSVTLPPGEEVRVRPTIRFDGTTDDGVAVFVEEKATMDATLVPMEGVLYLVSTQVRRAFPERPDLVSPGEPVTDPSGKKIGCFGVVRNSSK